MHAEDFGGECEVRTLEELRNLLGKRYEFIYNEVWLFDDTRDTSMAILVKDALSYLHYFPKGKGHPGFHSVGDVAGPAGGQTIFRMQTVSQENAIMNEAVVSFADAVSVAEQFFADPAKLPQAITWEEL